MAVKNVVGTATKVMKVVGSVIVSAAIVEAGYIGGKALGDDVELTARLVDSKVNPKVMKKRHWYSKPELYNTRTNKFVSDKTQSKKSK